VRANNHFGIKCGNHWRGKKMYKKDDDRNNHGKLVKSCFREFASGEQSYVAHSEFLMDPGKSHRYGFLFDIPVSDYKGWAKGLKKAGYATNPRYPQLLMKIIEEYQLDQFDLGIVEEGILTINTTIKNEETEVPGTEESDVRYVEAMEGQSIYEIAHSFDVPVKRLKRYNEDIGTRSALEKSEWIYLQPKRTTFRGAQRYHIVQEGEDMQYISDKYGVKLKSLYRRNKLEPGMQPNVHERIALKGNLKSAPAISGGESFLAVEDDFEDLPEITPTTIHSYYVVKNQDTLYSIARTHGLSVSNLKKMNNLESDIIQPGQKLKLNE
jgi:LysM repeat protein